MNDGTYACMACNTIDAEQRCHTIRSTSAELLSNGDDGDSITIVGLPLWVWILIIAIFLLAFGVAFVFCLCKPSENKKKYKAGGLNKDDISRPMNLPPDGQSTHYESMNSRHKLIPTESF